MRNGAHLLRCRATGEGRTIVPVIERREIEFLESEGGEIKILDERVRN